MKIRQQNGTMVTCYTCGLPSSTEWAQKISSLQAAPERPYFPFLLHVKPPPGAQMCRDGTTFVCAYCYSSLSAQWKNYERQAERVMPERRVYTLGKFICGVCGVKTYRRRVRTLPSQEFPFLASLRPVGSLALGNDNQLAIVCLDCFETLKTQNAEYDRWGLPLQKRRFNWLARQPPDPSSPEAGVARLPCGKIKIPSCPPTEPVVGPSKENRGDAGRSPIYPEVRKRVRDLTQGGYDPQSRVRKLSVVYATNPFVESKSGKGHSPEPCGSEVSNPSQTLAPTSQPKVNSPAVSTEASERNTENPSSLQLVRRNEAQSNSVLTNSRLSTSLPGIVFVPAMIYHPRRRLSPQWGQRYSTSLPSSVPQYYPSSSGRSPAVTANLPEKIDVREPLQQTSPLWVPLQKLQQGSHATVKRRRFSETVGPSSRDLSSVRKYSADSRLIVPSRSPISNNGRSSAEPPATSAVDTDSSNKERSSASSNVSKVVDGADVRGLQSSEEQVIAKKLERAVIGEPSNSISMKPSYTSHGVRIARHSSPSITSTPTQVEFVPAENPQSISQNEESKNNSGWSTSVGRNSDDAIDLSISSEQRNISCGVPPVNSVKRNSHMLYEYETIEDEKGMREFIPWNCTPRNIYRRSRASLVTVAEQPSRRSSVIVELPR